MNDLILDIKVIIASYNKYVWYYLYKYDKEFRSYAISEAGKKKFVCLFTKYKKYPDGEKQSLLFGELHSVYDKPAISTYDEKLWYYNGRLHRDNDKPASVTQYGDLAWFKHGKLHRENDLPAVIHCESTQQWHYNGLLHRENDQPAIIMPNNGHKWWYYHGCLHRENDQPAAIFSHGRKEWYIHGKLIKIENI